LEVVARAVELASQEKHICPFLDDVDKLIPYLLKLPESSFRNFLLNELDNEQFAVSIGSKTEEMLIEPLNKREREILRLMAVGNSNREIGDELFLSVNTIRWYASQIYVKLGVKNRGAAVARARELELIL
jgi:LuxR family maltose regulon positive regulatory protein